MLFRSVVPAPVPDEDNIAMTPIFQELFAEEQAERKRASESFYALYSQAISNKGNVAASPIPSKTKSTDSLKRRLHLPYVRFATNSIPGAVWQAGKFTASLDPWRAALSNDNLFAALAVYEDDLREVEAALKRSSFRPEEWDKVDRDDFRCPMVVNPLTDLTRMYNLRAWAKHDAGQYGEALDEIKNRIPSRKHGSVKPGMCFGACACRNALDDVHTVMARH